MEMGFHTLDTIPEVRVIRAPISQTDFWDSDCRLAETAASQFLAAALGTKGLLPERGEMLDSLIVRVCELAPEWEAMRPACDRIWECFDITLDAFWTLTQQDADECLELAREIGEFARMWIDSAS